MKTPKQIKNLYRAPASHMVGDGFKVFNYFPNQQYPFAAVSPFLLLDYNAPHHFPSTDHRKGVGAHPHRGFETVTIVFDGYLEHRDSAGGGGKIGPGDVQWMTAASGVLHDEFFQKEFSDQGGVLHAIQLWVNLPAKDKMSTPRYQTLLNAEIPRYLLDENGSEVKVIAGSFQGVKGNARTVTPIEMYEIHLKQGASVDFGLPAPYNTMLLVTQGKVSINDARQTAFKDFVLFDNKGEQIMLQAEEDSRLMVFSGEPIRESVVSYGPFVMNTREEIIQAIDDVNAGKFGTL